MMPHGFHAIIGQEVDLKELFFIGSNIKSDTLVEMEPNEIIRSYVPELCDKIVELNENAPKEQIRVTLQLSGHLLVGVTKVHRTQVQAVYDRFHYLCGNLKRFVLVGAEIEESNVAGNKKTTRKVKETVTIEGNVLKRTRTKKVKTVESFNLLKLPEWATDSDDNDIGSQQSRLNSVVPNAEFALRQIDDENLQCDRVEFEKEYFGEENGEENLFYDPADMMVFNEDQSTVERENNNNASSQDLSEQANENIGFEHPKKMEIAENIVVENNVEDPLIDLMMEDIDLNLDSLELQRAAAAILDDHNQQDVEMEVDQQPRDIHLNPPIIEKRDEHLAAAAGGIENLNEIDQTGVEKEVNQQPRDIHHDTPPINKKGDEQSAATAAEIENMNEIAQNDVEMEVNQQPSDIRHDAPPIIEKGGEHSAATAGEIENVNEIGQTDVEMKENEQPQGIRGETQSTINEADGLAAPVIGTVNEIEKDADGVQTDGDTEKTPNQMQPIVEEVVAANNSIDTANTMLMPPPLSKEEKKPNAKKRRKTVFDEVRQIAFSKIQKRLDNVFVDCNARRSNIPAIEKSEFGETFLRPAMERFSSFVLKKDFVQQEDVDWSILEDVLNKPKGGAVPSPVDVLRNENMNRSSSRLAQKRKVSYRDQVADGLADELANQMASDIIANSGDAENISPPSKKCSSSKKDKSLGQSSPDRDLAQPVATENGLLNDDINNNKDQLNESVPMGGVLMDSVHNLSPQIPVQRHPSPEPQSQPQIDFDDEQIVFQPINIDEIPQPDSQQANSMSEHVLTPPAAFQNSIPQTQCTVSSQQHLGTANVEVAEETWQNLMESEKVLVKIEKDSDEYKTLGKLVELWRQKVHPIDIARLLPPNCNRRKAASTFATVLVLKKRRLVDLEASEKGQITHITPGDELF